MADLLKEIEDQIAGAKATTAKQNVGVIREVGDDEDCVMIFGHNPELSELAHDLSDTITDMPTCAVAEFAFDIKSWSNVGVQEPAKATLRCPKDS